MAFRLRSSVLLAAVCALGACSERTPVPEVWPDAGVTCRAAARGGGFARTDSLGVSIALSTGGAWTAAERLTVADAPVVTIGVAEGDSTQEFGRVVAATRLGDGRIVIADGQSAELSVFSADGRFLTRTGGKGEGPGEYRAIAHIFRVAQDSLWIDDAPSHRITRLDPTLAVTGSFRLPMVPLADAATGIRTLSYLMPQGRFADGTLFAVRRRFRVIADPRTESGRDTFEMHRLDPVAGESDSLGLAVGAESYQYVPDDRTVWFGDMPLGYHEALAVAGDHYYYGEGTRFEIEEYAADGHLVRRIRLCERPDSIDDHAIDREIGRLIASITGEGRAEEERAMRMMSHPRRAPAYFGLMTDAGDRLWVRDFGFSAEPEVWKVFDGEGRWLGDVETPAGLTLLEIGDDYILGRFEDELGVTSVRLYELRAEAAGP